MERERGSYRERGRLEAGGAGVSLHAGLTSTAQGSHSVRERERGRERERESTAQHCHKETHVDKRSGHAG